MSKIHSYRAVPALHGNVRFRSNFSDLSWNRQSSRQKSNYKVSKNWVTVRANPTFMSYSGEFPLNVRFRYVSYMIALFHERLTLEFWNLVSWEIKPCRFQLSKSICSHSNPWLWTLKLSIILITKHASIKLSKYAVYKKWDINSHDSFITIGS